MPDIIRTEKDVSREELANHLENGNYPAAEEAIHVLLEQSPDDVGLLNSLGSIYAQRGDFFNAESTFQQAIDLDPGCGDAYYNLGLVYSRQSRKTEAIEKFLKAAEINPRDYAAHNDLGVLYHSQGKAHQARYHFIKALESNILYKRALLNLFEVCWDADSYSEGLAWVEKYLNAAAPDFDSPAIDTVPEYEKISEPVIKEATENRIDLKIKSLPGVLTLTKKSSSRADDIFLKHVPQDLREGKTGVNLAIVADFDSAGQPSLLFRLINRYTVHKARLIIRRGDYFGYDRDLNLGHDGQEGHGETLDIIEHADFYHICSFPEHIDGVEWENYLKPYNALIQYYGPEPGTDERQLYQWHTENRIVGLSPPDHNFPGYAPFIHHIDIMCDFSRIKPCSGSADIIRICHIPTNRDYKKTDLFLSTVEALKNKGYPIEPELIEGKTNEECLDIKSRCQMTYDRISSGTYGLSAIESMAAGHVVLCGVSNLTSSYYPDNPLVYVNEENLHDKLEFLLKNENEIARVGNAGKIWVRNNHDPMKLIRQYVWIYDLVMNGHGIVDDRDRYLLK